MPDADLAWTDLVRGEVRFAAGSVPDFVVVRANGAPLYPFVNPVDDALMGVTDVLRGEDLLPSTPRQLALYAALVDVGVATGTPRFGHLPYVTAEGNRKLSTRDPPPHVAAAPARPAAGGAPTGPPRFAHLPYVTGEGNRKLSKRDPTSNVDVYRERGFLPEGFAHYLARLGGPTAGAPPGLSRRG